MADPFLAAIHDGETTARGRIRSIATVRGTPYTVRTTAIFLRLVPSVLFLRLGEKEKKRDGGGRGGSERRKLSLPPFWPLRQEKCRIVAKISLRYLLRSLAAAEGGGGSPSRVLEGEKESR